MLPININPLVDFTSVEVVSQAKVMFQYFSTTGLQTIYSSINVPPGGRQPVSITTYSDSTCLRSHTAL